MKKAFAVCALAFACVASVGPAVAQEVTRTLHWRRLSVAAQLDAEGRLHVRERQAMVFDGAWNGGERRFNIRPGQRLEFHGIARIAPDGSAHRLEAGDLDRVDHFAWRNGNTLRWRSRLPSDPPFANQEITYEIDYTLSNILVPTADGYRLDHDFAFPDRDGMIETFTLDLEVDPDWQSKTPLPLHREQRYIPPGASVVVTLPLRYAGAGTPGGVQRSVPTSLRAALALALLGGLLWLLRGFFASENRRGRFAPLTPASAIDANWLQEHVFNVPAEVVGAAWDTKTAAPEVAAMIARMVQEGKLTSRVVPHKRKHILHLELTVARGALSAEERKLVNALFSGDARHTDTEKIRSRYSKSGFDPAALIRKSIEKQVRALLPDEPAVGGARNVLLNVLVVLVLIGLIIGAFVLSGGGPLLLAPTIAVTAGIIALVLAAAYRSSVTDLKRKAARFVSLLVIAVAPVVAVVLGLFETGTVLSVAPILGAVRPGVLLMLDLVVLSLAIVFLVLNAGRTRERPERLKLRRTLAAARAYFLHELRRPQPTLEDSWYPYLMAFGLGPHIDKWFRAFGPTDEATVVATAAGLGATTAAGWTGGGPLFGGGGGFGGGGAGRSWASAADSFSAGVAAPSSGDGGGGGGGSSGGGGGGGW